MPDWKKSFIERYEKLTDVDAFTEASLKPMRKSIRVNTLKTTIKEIKSRFKLEQVPWCKEGFFIKGKAIGNTLEHYLGYIYLQGAASMIPPTILKPKHHETILDMCASPGSKTTQMAAMMENTGIIVANDNKIPRLKPLTLNLQRCGVTNTVLTVMEGRWFKQKFDKILLDAPCSGIGTIRKSLKTISIWNPNMITKMARQQKELAQRAFENLKVGGEMVYSTCSLEPEENEGVVSHLLETFENAEIVKVKLPGLKLAKAVMEFNGKKYDPRVKDTMRIWPQDNDTEGFFVAKIIKKN